MSVEVGPESIIIDLISTRPERGETALMTLLVGTRGADLREGLVGLVEVWKEVAVPVAVRLVEHPGVALLVLEAGPEQVVFAVEGGQRED